MWDTSSSVVAGESEWYCEGLVRRVDGVRGLGAELLYLRPGLAHQGNANGYEIFPAQDTVTVFATAVADAHMRY